jgi:cytochrome P450
VTQSVAAAVTLEELERDPHPALARLRASEPVAFLPALGGWLVTGRDLALHVLRDAETFTVDDERFSTGRVVGPSMLTRDGSEHARHRAPFAPPLRLGPVRERYEAPVRVEVDALIDRFAPAGQGELRRELAGPLSVRVVTQLLGLDGAETATVLRWYDAIVASVQGITAGRSPSGEGRRAFAELSASVGPHLGRVADLSRAEAVSNAAVMMFGGIETTEAMIVNLVFHLLSSPGELELVRAEPDLLANAVEESLRLEPAAAVGDRYATCDVELAGARIREGQLVTVSLAGANRDPACFPDPDRFDVRRANARRHLAFAQGPHVCIGMHLARLEAALAAERLLDRLPGLRLDPRRPTAPRGLVFRKPPRLDVLWDGGRP